MRWGRTSECECQVDKEHKLIVYIKRFEASEDG